MKNALGLASVAIIAVCIGSGTAQSQEIRDIRDPENFDAIARS
jgi:hypothetical protein